jgi:hypothetical protein
MDNIAEPPPRTGWPDFSLYRPHPSATTLRDWLGEASSLTRVLTQSLGDNGPAVPLLQIVNPPLWELGHVAWFQEFWLHRGGNFDASSILRHADRWYDSARVAHDTRWTLDLPDWKATRAYFEEVFQRSLSLLNGDSLTDARAYFAQLAINHHDMHNEAFSYMWQTLAYPMPVPYPEPGASFAASSMMMVTSGVSSGATRVGPCASGWRWSIRVTGDAMRMPGRCDASSAGCRSPRTSRSGM